MAVTVYSSRDTQKALSEHFTVRDFLCPDGAAEVPVDGDLICLLERLYDALSCTQIKVTAGYRTASYARRINREKDVSHLHGKAADIICYGANGLPLPTETVTDALKKLGHRGGAVWESPRCVHVDVGVSE